ncbi:MAG TPA: DNA polymerase ligase N-terminal domain-containing protein [Solirubrobacterales bacterium]|nr:DNA polymerase ligase N-terminal domain-containing protein [Solirubrobacterales bacterium]
MAARRDKLSSYRSKRSFDVTSEPSGDGEAAAGEGRFVIQEHHARRLHWDFRLERDGVLVSWALPRGVPEDPDRNRLAVHVEDHPLDYIDFAGEIPRGEYGGGSVAIWDRGTYEAEKWEEGKVTVRLHGDRVSGRYALFRTRGNDWMIHRMDPPVAGDPLPPRIEPMLAGEGKRLPTNDDQWGYEIAWRGARAIALCDTGHLELQGAAGEDLRPRFPELFAIALELGGEPVAIDGVIAVLGEDGTASRSALERRLGARSDSEIRRRARDTPATLIAFDLLHAGRESMIERPYAERRERLEALELDGPNWQTPAYHAGEGNAFRAAARAQGVEAIVAKRLASPYRPGRRSRDWRRIGIA